MRALARNQFLLVEGVGQVDRVTIDGDNAKIEVLKAASTDQPRSLKSEKLHGCSKAN
jgi:hypothetical protein